MEFRIAPMIMAFINLIFVIVINPEINNSLSLSTAGNIWKMGIPFAVIFFVSIGAYLRHSYYTKAFKFLFLGIQLLNIILFIYYVYTIKSQHLG